MKNLLSFWCSFLVLAVPALLRECLVEGFSSAAKAKAFGAGAKDRRRLDDRSRRRRPKLILIGGCSGTGKSTFGMNVALDQGILKCISTDTLRSVMRSFLDEDSHPALHRSSYQASSSDKLDDPIESWLETCHALQHSVDELIDEMSDRQVSLVVEGVHLIPSRDLIEKWEARGGVATGIVLKVSDAEAHKSLLWRRGQMTGKEEADKLEEFARIRTIHDEMVRLAVESEWLILEQDLRPDPLALISNHLWKSSDIEFYPAPASLQSHGEHDVVINGESYQKAPNKDPLDGAIY